MSRNDPRPPRLPKGSGHRVDYGGISWDAGDDFAHSKARRDALDRIGAALHRHDVCPCVECRLDIDRAFEAFDRVDR